MNITIKSYFLLSLLFISYYPLQAQLGKTFPYSANYPYQLQAAVKSWTMTGEKGIIREKKFDKNRQLISDTGREQNGSNELMPYAIKHQLESINNEIVDLDKIHIKKNKKGQIIEKKQATFHVLNTFDTHGNILMSQTHQIRKHIYAHDSRGPIIPPVIYYDSISTLTLFKYNAADSLIEFEYFNADLFQNLRVVYKRDSSNYLVEKLTYDHYDIGYLDDNYIDKIIPLAKDNSFDVNTVFPEYWTSQVYAKPRKETYKNDTAGNRIEYICHCYRPDGMNAIASFKAVWEYSDNQIIKETHYELPSDKLTAIIEYDEKENIVKETIFYGAATYVFNYDIVYYK